MPLSRRGSDRASEFAAVYRDNVRAVYGYFAYFVDSAQAEDLTSATFERGLRSWQRYDPARASPRTWLLAIGRNVMIDHFRRASHRKTLSFDEHPELLEGLQATAESSAPLGGEELRRLLGMVGDRDRQVLALRFAADLSAIEVGRLLNLEPANVHQIASRALRRLRQALDGEATGSEAAGSAAAIPERQLPRPPRP